MESNRTPDEIAEQAEKIIPPVDPLWRALSAGALMVAEAFAKGPREQPTEPEPPTKAERIRECIRQIRVAHAEYALAYQSGEYPSSDYCFGRVWDLIRILEQDDCNV